jgi:UDP:flavonoid glycosyltransferase YjiC (YdhE family)
MQVSGQTVTQNAYTERRRKELDAINAEVTKFIASLKESDTWDDIPRAVKAKFWKRKASVLWTFEKPVPDSFFESDDFEYPLLRESEENFTRMQVYL